MTDLDDLKSAWQAGTSPLPPTEVKTMTQMTQMIESNVETILAQQGQHFLRSLIRTTLVPLAILPLFYIMSEGFTNEADSISTLVITMVLFIPLLLFFGSRYYAIKSLPTVPEADIRTQLPYMIHLLRRNQRAEVGVALFISLLAVGGALVALNSNPVMLVVMAATALLAIIIVGKIWQNYQGKAAELEGYLEQLSEL